MFFFLFLSLFVSPSVPLCRSVCLSLPPSSLSPSPPTGGLSSSSDGHPAVVRYRKDQRPTTLPIQPFTFHHQFASKPPQAKPIIPLLTGYISGMQQAQTSSGSAGSGGPEGEGGEDDTAKNVHQFQSAANPPPGSVRPSPLGSYSPVGLQGAPSSGTCSTCTPSPQPPHSLSCPLSAGLMPLHTPPGGSVKQGGMVAPLPLTPPPPPLEVKRRAVPPMLLAVQGHCCHHGALPSLPALSSDSLSPLGCVDSAKQLEGSKEPGARPHNGSYLSKRVDVSYV